MSELEALRWVEEWPRRSGGGEVQLSFAANEWIVWARSGSGCFGSRGARLVDALVGLRAAVEAKR